MTQSNHFLSEAEWFTRPSFRALDFRYPKNLTDDRLGCRPVSLNKLSSRSSLHQISLLWLFIYSWIFVTRTLKSPFLYFCFSGCLRAMPIATSHLPTLLCVTNTHSIIVLWHNSSSKKAQWTTTIILRQMVSPNDFVEGNVSAEKEISEMLIINGLWKQLCHHAQHVGNSNSELGSVPMCSSTITLNLLVFPFIKSIRPFLDFAEGVSSIPFLRHQWEKCSLARRKALLNRKWIVGVKGL